MSSYKLMLLLPLAALCAPASAQDAAPQQGMVVVRDAETGQLRTPTAAEIRSVQAAPPAAGTGAMAKASGAGGPAPAAAAEAPPAMVVGPGGSRSVRLGERHLVYSVVTRDGDGKLQDHCVSGAHAAQQTLSAPATKPQEHRHESR